MYNDSMLKAVGSAGGVGPRVFTYSTPDTLVECTTEGYFKDAVAIFEPNDIIFVNYDNGASNGATTIICVQSDAVDGGAHIVDFSTTASFAGDVRDTDAPLSSGQSITQNVSMVIDGANGVGNVFTYRHNSHPLANLNASAFWSMNGNKFKAGDLIHCIMNDGYQLTRILVSQHEEGQTSYGKWNVDAEPVTFA
ncbi:MAG: hypothetical protein DRG30_01150 [Epsilonproteobacteria bacterium]|nr:MAG: hypothetical protein DRG30_01150 [Campylobacterota bacterium]